MRQTAPRGDGSDPTTSGGDGLAAVTARARQRRRAAILAGLTLAPAVLAALVPSSAAALPGWSTHTLAMSTPGGSHGSKHAELCDLAVRSDGSVVASWHTITGEGYSGRTLNPVMDRAYVAEQRPGGSWSRPKLIWAHRNGVPGRTIVSGVYGSCPKIVLGQSRGLELVWHQYTETPVDPKRVPYVRTGPFSIRHLVRTTDGRWRTQAVLVRSGAFPAVASEDSGRAILQFNGRLGESAILRRPSGRWGRPVVVADPSSGTELRPIFDGLGNVTLTWFDRHTVMARRADRNGRWGAPQQLNRGRCGFESQSITPPAADGRGTVAVAWVCAGGASNEGYSVQVAIHGPTGQWRPAAAVDQSFTPIGPNGEPQPADPRSLLGVQFDGTGTAHLGWVALTSTAHSLDTTQTLRISSLAPGQSVWQPPTEVYVASTPISDYAVDQAGRTVFVFIDGALQTLERDVDGRLRGPLTHDGTRYAVPMLRAGGNRIVLGWTSRSRRGAVVAVR